MIRQEMCDNLEKTIVSFIVENTENDYDVGKKLADIIHKQLTISSEDLISGFIDGISEPF